MKKHLYHITEGGAYIQHLPAMPRVLAEKTAKSLQRQSQRNGWRFPSKYSAKKSGYITGDASPHGVADWFGYIAGRRA